MADSGPHFPRHDPETSWQALVTHGLETQAKHMAQAMSQIGQIVHDLGQTGANRLVGVQVMREMARGVMRDAEGLMAFSHLAETLLPLQPPLAPAAPSVVETQRTRAVEEEPVVTPIPKAAQTLADPLQAWREASSDAEFLSHFTAWMAKAEVDQDTLSRELGYKPVYIRRIMRGTDPITSRFRERLLDYAASRQTG